MSKVKSIGIGAAGNKSNINLIEKGVLPKEKIMLINSTLRDIPDDFRELAQQYENSAGGCGKERDTSASLCLGSLKNGKLGETLEAFVDPDDEQVIISASSEGGTGSGSAYIIGKYYRDVVGIAVHIFIFGGFEEDGRGLQNTIECFQDMDENFTVQAISNKKFLDECNGNKLKAEKMANDEFARRVQILTGAGMVDSEQNIDETDMFKVITTPGYMISSKKAFSKLKNVDQFNKLLVEMVDENKSIDTTKSAKRIAVIMNIAEESRDFVDYQFSVLKERYGVPYEIFTHIQYDEEQPEYISYIISGMKMPIDEVKEIYERYKEQSAKVDKKKDDFFSITSSFKGNEEDAAFNVNRRRNLSNPINPEKNRSSFFDSFNEAAAVKEEMPNNNTPERKPTTSKDNFIKGNF